MLQNIFGAAPEGLYLCTHNAVFSAASDGATVERQVQKRTCSSIL